MEWIAGYFTIETIQRAGVIAGSAATVIALLATIWKWVKPKLGDAMKSIAAKILAMSGHYEQDKQDHAKIFKALELLGVVIEDIRAEVKNNDGSSMRDSLNRVENILAYQGAFQMSSLHTWQKAIFITNADGAVTHVNRAHSRLTGFRPDECMGHEWINVIAPQERASVLKAWREAVAQGIIFDRVITYVKPGNVDPYRVHVHAVKIESQGGKKALHGYMGEIMLLEENEKD